MFNIGGLLEMLGILIEEYENRAHPLPKAEPHKMLAYLLAERGMKPSDLWAMLPKSRVSQILSGKRGRLRPFSIELRYAAQVCASPPA